MSIEGIWLAKQSKGTDHVRLVCVEAAMLIDWQKECSIINTHMETVSKSKCPYTLDIWHSDLRVYGMYIILIIHLCISFIVRLVLHSLGVECAACTCSKRDNAKHGKPKLQASFRNTSTRGRLQRTVQPLDFGYYHKRRKETKAVSEKPILDQSLMSTCLVLPFLFTSGDLWKWRSKHPRGNAG